MALWTPYADNSPLDLSKTAVAEIYPQISYDLQLPMHQGLHYDFYTPVGQVSPGSTSSGYDSVMYSPSTSRPVATSPALSPQSLKRPFSLGDPDCLSDDPDFQEYERNALKVMAEKNGGALVGNNPRMRRAVHSTTSGQDDAYRRQRERNNYAAKQSRDRRKLREIHLSLKVSYLKKQVAALKANLSSRVCVRCQLNCLCCL